MSNPTYKDHLLWMMDMTRGIPPETKREVIASLEETGHLDSPVSGEAANFLVDRVVSFYAPLAVMVAVHTVEKNGRYYADDLRCLGLLLCDKPSLPLFVVASSLASYSAGHLSGTLDKKSRTDGSLIRWSRAVITLSSTQAMLTFDDRHGHEPGHESRLASRAINVMEEAVGMDDGDTLLRIVADDLRAAIAIT